MASCRLGRAAERGDPTIRPKAYQISHNLHVFCIFESRPRYHQESYSHRQGSARSLERKVGGQQLRRHSNIFYDLQRLPSICRERLRHSLPLARSNIPRLFLHSIQRSLRSKTRQRVLQIVQELNVTPLHSRRFVRKLS